MADSVDKTVMARWGKIRAASMEIAQIINDWRAQAVGGMESALMLWDACCIPSLLHGSGTWTEITGQTVDKLNSLQRWFIRLVLQVGPGTPVASLLWDFGLLDMRLRVWMEKLMLVLHIRRLGEKTLARMIYEEQISENWPGLVQETEEICQELKIESVHTTEMNSRMYRKVVSVACHIKNEQLIRSQAEGKVKCDKISQEKYGKKDYIKNNQIHHVRQTFKAKFGMYPFAGNFSKDKRFARTDWLCRCGKAREEENHLTSGECELFGEIRAEFDNLDDDNNLVEFFNRVLEMRDRLDEEL